MFKQAEKQRTTAHIPLLSLLSRNCHTPLLHYQLVIPFNLECVMTSERAFDEENKVRRKKPPTAESEPEMDAGTESPLHHLQRTAGNAAVQRMVQRSGLGAAELDDETSTAIQRQRGEGHPLDRHVASNAGEALGADFEGVRIHTDNEADQINRQIGARAFTTGQDIFFREGEYSPHSTDGQKLIHHELTHVVQQKTAPGAISEGPLQVNDPHDSHEAEADRVADHLTGGGDMDVQRAAAPEEEELMAKPAEEEEEVMTKRLQRQEVEEEEMQQ